jgi:hypothetical protein
MGTGVRVRRKWLRPSIPLQTAAAHPDGILVALFTAPARGLSINICRHKSFSRQNRARPRAPATATLPFHFMREFKMPTIHRLLSVSLLFASIVFASSVSDTASAQDRRVQIINASGVTVNSFQASNTRRKSWEEDILGKSVLPHGQSIMVNINDGTGACVFDFRAVLASGRKVESYGMNVCQISSWTIR